MKFHLGFASGVLVCLLICMGMVYLFYPEKVLHACSPVINLLDSCLKNKQNLELSKQETSSPVVKTFKYGYLFNKLKNMNYTCPNATYDILKLSNSIDQIYCLYKKYPTYLGIRDLKTDIVYNYLFSINDGVYDLEYKTDTMSFLTFVKNESFDEYYNTQGDRLIIFNPKYDIKTQENMLKNEIKDFLLKHKLNLSIDPSALNDNNVKLYCTEISYPFLNPKVVGRETIKEIVYDIFVNRGYLDRINKHVDVFDVNLSYEPQNKLYNIKICFGLKKLIEDNTTDTNISGISDLSKKLKGKTELETAYNILKWVDKNIEYDNDKANEIENGKEVKLRNPSEVLKDKKAICSEYSIFIDKILMLDGITPYYIVIKYKNKKIEHAVAAIYYNKTYYILDQHLPLVDLDHYIYMSHLCDNDSFEEMDIYKVDKGYNKDLVKKIKNFVYTLKEKPDLEKIKKELIKMIENKYHLKYVNNISKSNVDVIKIITNEFKFYCLYPKLGSKGLTPFDAKYIFDVTINDNNKLNRYLKTAKCFDVKLKNSSKDIIYNISIGF